MNSYHFRTGTCPGQTGTFPGTNRDPSLGQTGTRSLLNSTVKSPFCPGCSWDGSRFVLGRLSRKGRQKNVCVFAVSLFFSPLVKQLRLLLAFSLRLLTTWVMTRIQNNPRAHNNIIKIGTSPPPKKKKPKHAFTSGPAKQVPFVKLAF